MKNEYNWETAAAQLRSVAQNKSGPRLSFYDKCSAYAAILCGASHKTVSEAFGITRQAATQLASCKAGERADRQKRYRAVASEFERLGDRRFMETYYPEEIHQRVYRITVRKQELGDDRRNKGPNRQADKYEFRNHGIIESLQGELWRIDWIDAKDAAGWYFVNCSDRLGSRQEPITDNRYKGMECLESADPLAKRIPFLTSNAARIGLKNYLNEA